MLITYFEYLYILLVRNIAFIKTHANMRILAEYTVRRPEEVALLKVPQSDLASYIKKIMLREAMQTLSHKIDVKLQDVETNETQYTGHLGCKATMMFHVYTEETYQAVQSALAKQDIPKLMQLLNFGNL